MRRCIFHYPGEIEDNPKVGSSVRPKMMLAAFRQMGYDVDEVTGNGKERKKKIGMIKKNIDSGIKYDFIYSESRNVPTLLTEESHVPLYPLMDFRFFNICRKKNIKIGLFYRDMHWKFDLFKESVALHKRMILVPMFKYDLKKYKKLVDVLYIPTNLLERYLPNGFILKELPPGGNLHEDILKEKEGKKYNIDKLKIFYVGGVDGLYDMRTLFQAVKKNEKVSLIVCTPKEQWEKAKENYRSLLCNRIKVVHKKNNELDSYYKWADVVSVCFEKNKYTELATPIKAFEAISYGVPIIASKNTAISKKIKEENIGWVIDYSLDTMSVLFNDLISDYDDVKEKTTTIIKKAVENTWNKRAEQVIRELTM